MRRPLALLIVAAACAAPAAGAASPPGNAVTPTALYAALMHAPVAGLPDSYQFVDLKAIGPSATAKKHHAVGDVGVEAVKSEDNAQLLYIVFPTHADAVAYFTDGEPLLPKTRLSVPAAVPKPAVLFTSPQPIPNPPGKPYILGTTVLVYVSGDVIVEVETLATTSKTTGDLVGTIALGQYAFDHLGTYEKPSDQKVPPPGYTA